MIYITAYTFINPVSYKKKGKERLRRPKANINYSKCKHSKLKQTEIIANRNTENHCPGKLMKP